LDFGLISTIAGLLPVDEVLSYLGWHGFEAISTGTSNLEAIDIILIGKYLYTSLLGTDFAHEKRWVGCYLSWESTIGQDHTHRGKAPYANRSFLMVVETHPFIFLFFHFFFSAVRGTGIA
jgi:hypothetical protein